jgi:hypothetical protein
MKRTQEIEDQSKILMPKQYFWAKKVWNDDSENE